MHKILSRFAQRSVRHSGHHRALSFINYLTNTFNDMDYDRLRDVGSDRLCAEWILKNGGRVRLLDHKPPPPSENDPKPAADPQPEPSTFFVDYNDLPQPDTQPIRVKEIDASDSTITPIGCRHLRNCHHIDRIVLHNCRRLSDVNRLRYVADSLRVLQISECPIGDEALMALAQLRRLQLLVCSRLAAVRDMNAVREHLKRQLPSDCELMLEAHSQMDKNF